jgi:membrane-bound lytic murein transglycosylase B
MKDNRAAIFTRMVIVAAAAIGTCVPVAHAQDIEQARAAFIARMVENHGFAREALEQLFAGVEVNERILEAIARPAERVLEWHDYEDLFVTEERIAAGVEFWTTRAAEIHSASAQFGVAPEMLVAIIGIETWFGTRMGRYPVLESLSTLGFAYPPRARFFANELEAFLLMAREEQLDPATVLGSYAGAMGAGQFIPTSFRAYAVDANADGRRDLWGDWEDVLGSVANYFKVHGWRQGEQVAMRVARSPSFSGPEPPNSMDLNETIGSLREYGYTVAAELPASTPVTILGLQGRDGVEYWIGLHNFHVITRYNRSVKYALAAKVLADAILTAAQRTSSAEDTAANEDEPV